jgi:hypothetical protein
VYVRVVLMDRSGRIIRIIIFLVAIAMVVYTILPAFREYLPGPLKEEVEERERREYENLLYQILVDRLGYKKCGEYTLKHGVNHIDIYGVTNKPLMCYYLFKLPEPKSEYVLYLPWGEHYETYEREEDLDKILYHTFYAHGVLQRPHYEVVPPTPFIAECKGSCGGFDINYASGFRKSVYSKDGHVVSASYEFVSQDGIIIYAVKPEVEGMPIRYWLTFHGIVYRRGEEPTKILPQAEKHTREELREFFFPLRENMTRGGPEGDTLGVVNEVVLKYVEGLGYSNCGTHKLVKDSSELNITHIIEDPYRGEACYILLESEKPVYWRADFKVYPVWSGNLSKMETRDAVIYWALEERPLRVIMFDLLGHHLPDFLKEPAYSRSFTGSWSGDSGITEELQQSKRSLILFYFKIESTERQDIKTIFSMHITFRHAKVHPILESVEGG